MSKVLNVINDKYEIIKLLGEGSYGKAYLAKEKLNNV